MEKEFIPYEESLELKELGFNERCLAFWTNCPKYIGENIQLCITDGRHGKSPNSISFQQDFLKEGEVLAPTFSQAFKWLLKNYSLYSVIIPTVTMNWTFKTMTFTDGMVEVPPYNYVDANDYNSYEEAELECLRKLIQIVKNGKAN